MYKTVRHGENSLQYTILPQNDDFRMDCKLSSAESSCSSSTKIGGGGKHVKKRPRRRSFYAYLGLIFVCTVIIGAVLIPFLVSAECFPNATDWFMKSKIAFMRNNFQHIEHNKHNHSENEVKHKVISQNVDDNNNNNNKSITSYANIDGNKMTTTTTTTTEKPTTTIITKTLFLATEVPLVTDLVDHDVTEIHQNDVDDDKLPSNKENVQIKATAAHSPFEDNYNSSSNNKIIQAPAPALPAQSAMQQQQQQTPSTINNMAQNGVFVSSPHAPAAAQQLVQSQTPAAAMPTITTRIIQVPLLKSTAKKPIIPPVLVKSKSHEDHATNAATTTTTNDDVHQTKHANKNIWLKAHWPYIDPSSYFQWTGYKAEDSVLLPAILGIALLIIILLLAVCLLARNKRRLVTMVKKRKRHDMEEAGAEDNATLLTATNLSDED